MTRAAQTAPSCSSCCCRVRGLPVAVVVHVGNRIVRVTARAQAVRWLTRASACTSTAPHCAAGWRTTAARTPRRRWRVQSTHCSPAAATTQVRGACDLGAHRTRSRLVTRCPWRACATAALRAADSATLLEAALARRLEQQRSRLGRLLRGADLAPLEEAMAARLAGAGRLLSDAPPREARGAPRPGVACANC